ncbi:unnamed protein product [Paramecium primaurelia]|uniref:Transmembrane protein n=1 Tax=Paramecium primaurelia TaxID=5886 RepID=A0A8S1MJ71_PARPR|nr:unnamed protein product [Paramecium primaurelia]
MFYSVLFFIALTTLVFITFILLNKSQLQFEEKLTSKTIIIGLFALVVLMNQIQLMSQFKQTNKLANIFSELDLIEIPSNTNIQELNVPFNKTKGIYFTNNTLPFSLQQQLENTQKPYLHINFDHYSALNIDTIYLNKKMSQLQNELLKQQSQPAILLIKIESFNQEFFEYLEQIFELSECTLILYGSQIQQIRHIQVPSFFRFSQQLVI